MMYYGPRLVDFAASLQGRCRTRDMYLRERIAETYYDKRRTCTVRRPRFVSECCGGSALRYMQYADLRGPHVGLVL